MSEEMTPMEEYRGLCNSESILSIFDRNYRFSVSRNIKGFSFTESIRNPYGNNKMNIGSLSQDKEGIINVIDYSRLDKEYKLSNQVEYEFFIKDVRTINKDFKLYKIFFYNVIREMIWERIKETQTFDGYKIPDSLEINLVDTVNFMSIDIPSRMVNFDEIHYSYGRFNDSISIDFEFANKYIDLDKLINLVNSGIENKELIEIEMSLHAHRNFKDNRDDYLFDLPIFMNCHSDPIDPRDSKEDWITTMAIFSNELWDGNYENFIKK